MKPSTDLSVRPRFSTVSIMPGIETAAPERTETSSGSFGIAQLLAHQLLELAELLFDLVDHADRILAAVLAVVGAGFGGDREARRNRQFGKAISARFAPLPPRMGFIRATFGVLLAETVEIHVLLALAALPGFGHVGSPL
jgi:hypothetical protein